MKLRGWVAMGCIIAAVSVAVLAVGSAPRWAQAIVGVIVAIGVVSQLVSRGVPERVSPLLVLLGIATTLTILQLIPAGDSVVSRFNPTGAALRADGSAVAGISPAQTLTFDVPGTLSGLAFLLILLGVATISLRIATTERGRYALLATVAGVCGVTAAVVGLHLVFDTRVLYGLYEPLHANPRILGPLLNDNQLGCLMALGSVVAASLVLYRRQGPKLRAMWIVVSVGCAVVAIATLSRGAAIGLGCGAIVLAATLIGQRMVKESRRENGPRSLATGSLPIGIVAVCAVFMVVFTGAGGVSRQLQNTSLDEIGNPRSKFAAWRSSMELIEESPWIGWGRGAFESAFTRVHPTSGLATFSHLENEYLQAVVDWGVPGAVLLGVAGIWLAISALRRWRGGALAAGGLAGVTLVALQSNVDFGIEFLGLAVPATMVAATLTYVPLREPGRRALWLTRLLRLGHAVAIVVGAAALLSTATTSVSEDHDDKADPTSVTVEDVHDSLERHPLDYRGYLLQAIALTRNHDDHAIQVLNHALQLHPTHPGLHLFAAELLRQSGNLEQATIEYQSAIRSSPDASKVIGMILERMPTPQLIAASIPADDSRYDDILRILEEQKRADVAIEWLERVLIVRPRDQRTCRSLFSIAGRTRQVDAIAMATDHCAGYQPPPQIRMWLARTALENHDDDAAIRLVSDVETWDGNVNDKLAAWLTLCDAEAELEQFDTAEKCLHRLDATGYSAKRDPIEKRLDKIHSERIVHDQLVAAGAITPGTALQQRRLAQLVARFLLAEFARVF
jgi:O-antigen ligase